MATTPPPAFGALLRAARRRHGLTQLALALQADVSTRHLSWLESGRSEPSRAMVLRLAGSLAVPLRERNAWLAAAGYAPLYAVRALDDPALAAARAVLQRLLDAHEPWPALAVDRHWNLVAHNRTVPLLLAGIDPALLAPPANVLRASLHPRGLAPRVADFPAWRAHVLQRLARLAAASGDPALAALRRELQALPLPPGVAASPGETGDDAGGGAALLPHDVAVPLTLAGTPGCPQPLHFLTTVTVFGTPHDITLSELAVETLLPADEATAAALRRLLHAASVAPSRVGIAQPSAA